MKKQIAVLAAVAVVVSACADGTGNPLAGAGAPSWNHNEVNGPTFVIGTYARNLGGTVYTNTHPQGLGTCRDETGVLGTNGPVWYNGPGNRTSAGHCILNGAGSTVICSFSVPATFAAQAHDVLTTGNGNLNFDPDVFVHYQLNHDHTTGSGMVAFTATCTGGGQEAGTLALSQFSRDPGTSFLPSFQDQGTGKWWGELNVLAPQVKVEIGASQHDLSTLTWEYRSGVGS